MLRYDYHVPSREEILNEDRASNNPFSRMDSPLTSLTSLLHEDQIRRRLVARRKCLGLVGLIVLAVCAFSALLIYAVKHAEPPLLEDVYPESSEKLTVIFPDEQARNELSPSPETITTSSPSSTTSTSSFTTKPADIIATTSPGRSASTEINNSALVSQPATEKCQLTRSSPKRRGKSQEKNLPENAANRNPIDLLNHMAILTDYKCWECEDQIYGYELFLPMHNTTFGPYYAKKKKIAKQTVAAKASNCLFNITYPPRSDIVEPDGLRNCEDLIKC